MQMKRSAVPNCIMLCPTCPRDATRIVFHAEQDEVRCPQCRAHFRVETRRVADTTQQISFGENVRYRVFTAEPSGRVRMRRFVGSIGVKILRDERVTFVWRAGRLMGVANQTAQTWYPLMAHSGRARGLALRLAMLAVAAFSGLVLYGAADLTTPLRSGSIPAFILVFAAGAVVAAPWLSGLRTSHETAPATDASQKRPGS